MTGLTEQDYRELAADAEENLAALRRDRAEAERVGATDLVPLIDTVAGSQERVRDGARARTLTAQELDKEIAAVEAAEEQLTRMGGRRCLNP